MRGAADVAHLAYAADAGLALVTCNRRDFMALHWEWMTAGRTHAGIIIADQAMGPGERVRRLVALSAVANPSDLGNRLEFLIDWP